MIKKTSLYASLTLAILSVFLLLSYTILMYLPSAREMALLLKSTPSLTTTTWGIFDPGTGILHYGSEIDIPYPIASITKLFTAYAVLTSPDIQKPVTLTWSDIGTEGRSGKLAYGDTLTLHELLFPLLLESSNDAGSAIERTLGATYHSTISALISEKRLTQTHIADATGLSADNTSTVRELAILYAFFKGTYPHMTDITQLRTRIGDTHGWMNNNPLRAQSMFSGGKHGYTPEAGKTFVGTVLLPYNRGEIGIVLLHSSDLEADVESIIASF